MHPQTWMSELFAPAVRHLAMSTALTLSVTVTAPGRSGPRATLYRSFSVPESTLPVTVIPASVWKARTAARAAAPKRPSTVTYRP